MTLERIGRLLIDGNNLLHRISGSADPAAQRLLLARLNGALPRDVPTIVMLDGHPAAGTDRHHRLRRGLEIHHSGSISADDALINLVRDSAVGQHARITLVSDDRALVDRARHLGALTQRLDWLENLLDHPPAATARAGIGARKPPRPERPAPEREPWQPGRGATRKRGNPRRERRGTDHAGGS